MLLISFIKALLHIHTYSWICPISVPCKDRTLSMSSHLAFYRSSSSNCKSLKTWVLILGSESHCLINWDIKHLLFYWFSAVLWEVLNYWLLAYPQICSQQVAYFPIPVRNSLFIQPNQIGISPIYRANKCIKLL